MSALKPASFEEIMVDIENLPTDTVAIVADDKVWGLYRKKFPFEKMASKKNVVLWQGPGGELAKTFTNYEACLEYLVERGVNRHSHLIALGGGSISDFAGFVSATILRGISWSVIPTTLLGMVDAAIGGKVAINSRHGKNLIGSFHLPDVIWHCPDFLKTLDESAVSDGKGEVIKYAMINKEVYDLVMRGAPLDKIINHCAKFKMDIVAQDFQEHGLRKILNFGHTFGHALERAYSMPHGTAVVWGIFFVLKIFHEEKHVQELREVLRMVGWKPTTSPWSNMGPSWEKLFAYIRKDKKRPDANHVDWIHLEEVGLPKVVRLTFEEAELRITKVAHEFKSITL